MGYEPKPISPLSLQDKQGQQHARDSSPQEDDEDEAGMDFDRGFAPLQPSQPPGSGDLNPAGFQGSFQSNRSGAKRTPTYLPTVEEPICVLNIELDGEHNEEIKILENDDPEEVV